MRRIRDTLRRLEKLVGRKPDIVERLCVVREGQTPDCGHCGHHGPCLVIVEKIVEPETSKAESVTG